MEEVGFCSQCRRLVDLRFNYCPWCGEQRKTTPVDFTETLNKSCHDLQNIQTRNLRNHKLDRMEQELSSIEEDLQLILSREKK